MALEVSMHFEEKMKLERCIEAIDGAIEGREWHISIWRRYGTYYVSISKRYLLEPPAWFVKLCRKVKEDRGIDIERSLFVYYGLNVCRLEYDYDKIMAFILSVNAAEALQGKSDDERSQEAYKIFASRTPSIFFGPESCGQ